MVKKIAEYGKTESKRSETKTDPTETMAHFHSKSSMVRGSMLQVKCKENLLVENLQTKMEESNIVEKNVYKDVIEYLECINLSGD